MSAQRRSSASNRRARGASGRKSGTTSTVEPSVETTATPAVAVVEPTSSPATPTRQQPRMATDKSTGQGRRNQRMAGVRRYIADTRAELRRVTWPDQLTVRNLTGVVIAVSAVMGLLLGGIDFVLLRIFEAL